MPANETLHEDQETIAPAALDAIDHVISNYQFVSRHFIALENHHRPSAEHVMRVSIAITQTALELGIDAQFGALCALEHDTGKLSIPKLFLEVPRLPRWISAIVGKKHMKEERKILRAIPESELPKPLKQRLLSVVMNHHERFPNGNGPYPRFHTNHRPGDVQRRQPDPATELFQILLAMTDQTDRSAHGWIGERNRSEADVIADVSRQINNPRLDHLVELVARSVCAVTPEVTDRGMHIVEMARRQTIPN